MTVPLEMTVEQVRDLLASDRQVILLDVRHDFEWTAARIESAVHIPLDQLAGRLDELDRQRWVVVYCHLGVRSLSAARYLRQHGFAKAVSMAGGIDAWSRRIDQRIARYDYKTLKARRPAQGS